MLYDIFSIVAIPVYLRHSIAFREGSAGRLDITVGPKQTMGKTVSSNEGMSFPNLKPCQVGSVGS